MSVSRGRRSTSVPVARYGPAHTTTGRESPVKRASPSPSERRRGTCSTTNISPARKESLRKFLLDLVAIIDENGEFPADAGVQREQRVDLEIDVTNEDDGDDKEKSAQIPPGQEIKSSEKEQAYFKAENVTRFLKLIERHGQLAGHIQILLIALSAGGRSANALKEMHEVIARIRNSFGTVDGTNYLYPVRGCATGLQALSEASKEVGEAFQELGLFNTDFFDTLQGMTNQSKFISVGLDAEYGNLYECRVDEHLDTMFEPLSRCLDSYVTGLTGVAEKDIPALRQSQDVLTQRYLNLTTIATFLSSVTATTLQITADDAGSPLTVVMNTMWFISLISSTASAVYSLLVMTWRRSSVRQPNKAFPLLVYKWFHGGPMYTLIAALLTFSIGLCLLAFRVGDQEGTKSSPAIPVTFAGIHAHAILILSAWFLLERWKRKHAESWVNLRDHYLTPPERSARKLLATIKQLCAAVERCLKESWSTGNRWMLGSGSNGFPLFHIRMTIFQRPDPISHSDAGRVSGDDVELGEGTSGRPASSASRRSTSAPPAHATADNLDHELPLREISDQVFDVPEIAVLESALQISDEIGIDYEGGGSDVDEQQGKEPAYKPLANLLEFAPYGNFLAFAHKNSVTIYDGNNSFSVLTTFDTPDKDEVKEISWSPFDYTLVVKSIESLSIWRLDTFPVVHATMVSHLREAVASVGWTVLYRHDDYQEDGLVFSFGSSIKLFDKGYKEVWSLDVRSMFNVTCVVDASVILKKHVLCLVKVPDDMECSRLLVINVWDKSVQSEHKVAWGHSSMSVSLKSNRILFLGSSDGAELAHLEISEYGEYIDIGAKIETLRACDRRESKNPEGAVVFHGGSDKLMIAYQEGGIAALYLEPAYSLLMTMHRFTTPTAEALPNKPMSFAANAGPDSPPYMLAFSDEQGSVTIWTVQSNTLLSGCPSAQTFEVHDAPDFPRNDRTITTGKFLTLHAPLIS